MATQPSDAPYSRAADDIAALAAKVAIANNLAQHSRGVDRNDFALLTSAYHDDAEVSYGMFDGPAADMARFLTGSMAGAPVTLHRTSNMWIALDGAEQARSESYVIAYLRTPDEEGRQVQRLVGGRYLDRHEQRGGAWKIAHRTYVMDWNVNWPSTEAEAEAAVPLASFGPRGAQGAADPGRTLLACGAAHFRGDRSVSTQASTADIGALLSRQALHELLMAYCRGADRADAALLGSVFHDDATVVTGTFNGGAGEFARFVANMIRNDLRFSFHSVANEWFEIDGDRAVSESYVIAVTGAGERDLLTGGRYLDRFERRGGVWKIAQRSFITDWTMNQPASGQESGMYAQLPLRGRHAPDDPVYSFWPSQEVAR